MDNQSPLESLSDDELLRRLDELMHQSRRVEVDLVAHIAEADERTLYAREASPSMFAYCTEILHLSEAEAYLRIAAARASREYPMLLAMLGDGRLHLTGIAKLAPHLTPENRDALLKRATHKSKRQIEGLVAAIAPRPDVPAVMRKLPERTTLRTPALPAGANRAMASLLELCPDGVVPLAPAPTPASPSVVQPLAPARYKVQFTASAELQDKLERLRALMRSQVPDGDLAAIIGQAVTESWNGSRPGASPGRRLPGRGQKGQTPPGPRVISRPRSGVRCTSGTVGDAATWTRRADDVPNGTGSSITTSIPSVWVVTTVRRTSTSRVGPTTLTAPNTTTEGRRWPDTVA